MAAMPLYNPTHHMAAATSPGAAAAATGSLVNMQMNMGKDSRWLTLEVCREFQRSRCTRSDLDCKFAHPPSHVEIQNGRVTCCFDSIKGKCTRKEPPCKYLHPPQHLKEQLLQNGRTNLLMRQQLSMYPSAPIPLGPAIPQLAYDTVTPRVTPAAAYNPPGVGGLVQTGHGYVMQAYNPFGPTAAPAGYPYTGAAAVMPSLTAAGMMSAGYPASVAVSAGAMPSVSGGGGAGEGLVPLATTSTAVSSPSPASGASGIVSAAPKRADRLESATTGTAGPSAAAAAAAAQVAAVQQAHAQQAAAVQQVQAAQAAAVAQQQQTGGAAAAAQAAQVAALTGGAQAFTTQDLLALNAAGAHPLASSAKKRARDPAEDFMLQALPATAGVGVPMVKRAAMEGKAGVPMFPYAAGPAYPQLLQQQPGYQQFAFAGHPPGMPRF